MALPAPRSALNEITAKWRYAHNNGDHFAYDYAMPTGTALYATNSGRIADHDDGVVDYTPNQPGNKPGQPGRGSPSNWVLLETRDRYGRKVTIYYQHLFDVIVKVGQQVKAGQVIGYSGDTGNSTGPHLHIAAMKGWGYTKATRYAYMNNNGQNRHIIYPPTKAWDGVAQSPLATRARRYTTVGVTTLALLAGAFGVSTTSIRQANPAVTTTVNQGTTVVIPKGSRIKPVPVKAKVWAKQVPTRAKVKRPVVFTGKASPILGNVVLQRYTGGKWVKVSVAKIRTTGRFTLRYAPARVNTTYAMRVVKPGTSLSRPGASKVLVFRTVR